MQQMERRGLKGRVIPTKLATLGAAVGAALLIFSSIKFINLKFTKWK